MNIVDFLPKYPNIVKKHNKILNPYDDDFYDAIFKKREFYEEMLPEKEDFPDEKGTLMKHQKIIARFLSSHTMYDSLLLVHIMGSGKTCSAIGAIEQIKNEQNNFKGAYIFAKGRGLLNNFIKELRDKCTAGQYIPEGYSADTNTCGAVKKKGMQLTETETFIRTKKLYQHFYHFSIGPNKPTTFETFAKHLKRTRDADIIAMYSDHIIVIDEVHNLRIQNYNETDNSNKIQIYEQFHRFLHLVKNCKILLLSGTPMKDTPDEIASIMNLILPDTPEEQLPTGDKFITKYLEQERPNLYRVKENMIADLKNKFKGRVSFLKSMKSEVKQKFIGKNIGDLQHFIVKPTQMSEYQTSSYKNAISLDSKGDSGVYSNARQASLFVFPDKSYGSNGFTQNLIRKQVSRTYTVNKSNNKKDKPIYSFTLKPDVIKSIKGKNNEETLKKLRKFSSKYAYVIKKILDNPKKSCFVYSELVTGSGAIVFAQILKLFGFSPANGTEGQKTNLRYGLLTTDTASSKQISNIINCFNQPANKHGEIIRVLIGSRVVSEGVTFNNIQQEFILTPWFNYSETEQAIARGYRLNSHSTLLNDGETPTVSIYQMVAMPDKKLMSVDLHMYETSEDKDISIKRIMRLLMESAFDCALNYNRNKINGEKGKRECDYQNCEYVCDGIDMNYVKKGLPTEQIDNSTYQLYYSDPKDTSIRKKLDKLFKKYNDLDIDSIVNYFGNEYTEWEIRNTLKTIINRSEENLYYKDYINIYSRSIVKKITNSLEQLFRNYFRISFENITEKLLEYTNFEILTALKNIIDESIVIKNKYGFPSYLREYQNVYFLVDSLSINHDPFSEYYSRVPHITTNEIFSEILYNIQIKTLPKYIEMLCKVKNQKDFTKFIKSIPEEVQEMIIEAAILARKNKITKKEVLIKLIFEYFTNYIHKFDGVWVSSRRLNDKDILRCLEKDKWEDCYDKYGDKLEQRKLEQKYGLEKNPWGYYGKYNPETKTFSIVNVLAQVEKHKKSYEAKLIELNKKVEKGKMTENERDKELKKVDYRNEFSGKNCTSWSVAELLKIGVRVLELDYPEDFNRNETNNTLRKLVLKDKHLTKVYTKDEIKHLTNDQLRRALYYVSRSSKIKHICDEIQKWMTKTKWNGYDMLIPDSEVGKQGGHKKKIVTETVNQYRIETIIPEENPQKFKNYSKDIENLMYDCFKIEKYTPNIDNKKWIFIFLRKKTVGFLTIDSTNIIWNVCVAPNYRNRGVAQEAIQKAVEYSCPIRNPRLLVDNKGKTYDKLIKLYNKYGFNIIKNDGQFTTMEFKCK